MAPTIPAIRPASKSSRLGTRTPRCGHPWPLSSPRGPTRCACCSPNITPDYANRRAVTALAQGLRAKEPMRSKRRASPSLRIICVHVIRAAGAGAPGPCGPHTFAHRRGHPWPRSALAAHAHRAARALRAHARARALARPPAWAARLNRCAVQADAASRLRQEQKRVSRTRPDRLPTDAATCAIALRRACARASPLGLRPNTPRALLVGRRPTLTATGRSVLYPSMHHPLRYRLDVRHDPHAETPFMQNRSCCFCLTCAPAWAKTCIKGFFEDRRTRVRAHRTRKAAPHQGLAPSPTENRVGSECCAVLRSDDRTVPVT